jgi:hypothetical protein
MIAETLTPAGEAVTEIDGVTEIVTEIDGIVIDAGDDRCQEVVCSSSTRIEVKVLGSTGAQLQANDFSYSWHFNPPDESNRDMVKSRNYAIIYSVPCDHTEQTVTIEVLEDGETIGVRSICFNINRQP